MLASVRASLCPCVGTRGFGEKLTPQTFRNLVTRPTSTHSTTKMLPS